MSSVQKSRIAQMLAGNPGVYDSEGLESPPEQQILQHLGTVAAGYGVGSLGAGIAKALAQKAMPVMQEIGEAGALFPETASPESLPVMPKGAKTGDPHALYAYTDDFGPNMAKRQIYNVFGDPANPAIQQAGWGSSLPAEDLKKFGIPIVGREPPRAF